MHLVYHILFDLDSSYILTVTLAFYRDLQDASVYEESNAIQRLREDLRICQTELRYLCINFYVICQSGINAENA